MGKLLVAAILAALGIFGYFHYKHARAEAAQIAALPPAPPPPPPRSLEERAAAAQGTTLPADVARVPVRKIGVERENSTPAPAPAPASMQCDGRQYCSQMRSCAEATWFLQHCPTVKMDGDGDGVPCERQWCGG